MSGRKKSFFFEFVKFIFVSVLIFGITMLLCLLGYSVAKRNHGWVMVQEVQEFTESAEELNNPNRGFYYIYGFWISDESKENYAELVSMKMGRSQEHSLAMVQINLQEYAQGDISQKGLEDIKTIFHALEAEGMHYLIRFLYDWNGDNLAMEPQEVSIILKHMRQLQPVFQEYQDIIFVHQGLFIGNWGEMNGTKHLEHMRELAETLKEALADGTFLAVRMPAQWRKITGTATPVRAEWSAQCIAHSLGLYNDGMMGNYGDYGTYGVKSREEVGDFTHWNREEELAFQEELCRYVPNGGEVIVDNEFNDFENALTNLKTMHITYLNRDYDKEVLHKWSQTNVTEDSVFNGMDGLTYVDRHLGYRILIKEAEMNYSETQDLLSVKISLQNVGFAPIYKPADMYIQMVNVSTEECYTYILQEDIRKLAGGNESGLIFPFRKKIKLSGLEAGSYDLYFIVKDKDSDLIIQLANEQEAEKYGYRIGSILVEPLPDPLNRLQEILEEGIFYDRYK